MHHFVIIAGLLHATFAAVIGFFVLFAASRSDGLLKLVGNVLGIWLFVLAVLSVVGGFMGGPVFGGHMGMRMMGGHRPPWMQSGQPAEAPASAAPAPAPASAQPAAK